MVNSSITSELTKASLTTVRTLPGQGGGPRTGGWHRETGEQAAVTLRQRVWTMEFGPKCCECMTISQNARSFSFFSFFKEKKPGESCDCGLRFCHASNTTLLALIRTMSLPMFSFLSYSVIHHEWNVSFCLTHLHPVDLPSWRSTLGRSDGTRMQE